MTAIDILYAEHERIRSMLQVLGSMAVQMEKSDHVHEEQIEMVLEYLKGFADRHHHGKEEEMLFPALERNGIPRQDGPIDVMLHEHTEGRAHIRGMEDSLQAYRSGNQQAVNAFVVHARGYIELLGSHIEKENRILFPMASRVLPEAEMEALTKAFETFDTEEQNKGATVKYTQIELELKNINL